MEWTCLLVDLTQNQRASGWEKQIRAYQMAMNTAYVSTALSAEYILADGSVAAMIVFVDEAGEELDLIHNLYQTHVGCLNEFVAIVCQDPEPKLLARVFEFGTDRFFSWKNWPKEAATLSREISETLKDSDSPEARIMALTRALKMSQPAEIYHFKKEVQDLASYDFRAAFVKGKALEAAADYHGATEAFLEAQKLNRKFRPSDSRLGEVLLAMGRTEDAIKIFEHLEETNPWAPEHKANLAVAFIEKGDIGRAKDYLGKAEQLNPKGNITTEAKIQLLLEEGKVSEALKLLSNITTISLMLEHKLNEWGVQLSKSSRGDDALELFNRVHKIVNPVNKYKISLNAALACFYLGYYDSSLALLDRCESEFGTSFVKLEKARQAVLKAKNIS